MRTTAAVNRVASCTITWLRTTPISAASCRSAQPSSARAAASIRHTAATRAQSDSVVNRGVIRPSAYEDRAVATRPDAEAPAMTSSAGSAWWSWSATGEVARIQCIAREVAVSSTAALTPMASWQAINSSTARRSIAHAIRAVCASTEGSRRHICANDASVRGFLAYRPP
jgi:hypothetical protein